MYQRKLNEDIRCPLEYGMHLLSGKWKSRIICSLGNAKSMRYGELKANLINIADGVLSTNLNELVRMEMIEKISEGNAKGLGEYRLTKKAASLIPFLKGLCRWSGSYYKESSGAVMTHCLNCGFYKQWETDVNEDVIICKNNFNNKDIKEEYNGQ